jgi:hypothetical protein
MAGDAHEGHADAVAARVVAGESAEALLDRYAPGSSGARASAPGAPAAVQRREVHSEYHGELVTEELTREEITAIYQQLERIGGNPGTSPS